MSTDAGSPIPSRQPLLPHIRGLRIRRVAFDAPRLAHFRSSLPERKEVIEFIVETDGEIPARAYGPALFVGDVAVDQSEKLDKTIWRLLSFEPDRLQRGAPISWGWMKDPPASRYPTRFRYDVEGEGADGH